MSTTPLRSMSPVERDRHLSALLARNWWLLALRGGLAVLFGILAFAVPAAALGTLVILFSAYMVVDGACAIAAGVRAAGKGRRWGLFVLAGIANIAAGIVAFLWPAVTVLVFVYLLAGWAIVSGALMTAASFRLHLDHGRWWLALAGILSVLFGLVLAVSPVAGALVLTYWLAAYAVVFGGLVVATAFRLRRHRAPAGTLPGVDHASRFR